MIKPLLLASFCAAVGGCATVKESKPETRVFAHYSFDVPADLALEEVPAPFMDFSLYRIVSKSPRRKLGALFLGTYPRFPRWSWGRMPIETQDNVKTTKEFPYDANLRKMEGVMRFSGLSYKGSFSPWTRVSWSAEEIDVDQAAKIEGMIKSFKVVRPEMD